MKVFFSGSFDQFMIIEFDDVRWFWKFRIMVDPRVPVAQKSADEVVFRYFQGEEVEFF